MPGDLGYVVMLSFLFIDSLRLILTQSNLYHVTTIVSGLGLSQIFFCAIVLYTTMSVG